MNIKGQMLSCQRRPALQQIRWPGWVLALDRAPLKWALKYAQHFAFKTQGRRNTFSSALAENTTPTWPLWRAGACRLWASPRCMATTAALPGAPWATRHGSFRTDATALLWAAAGALPSASGATEPPAVLVVSGWAGAVAVAATSARSAMARA